MHVLSFFALVFSFFHYSTASRDISIRLTKEKEFDSAAIMTICLSVVPSVVQWPLTTNSNRKLSNPPAPYALYNSRIIHILLQYNVGLDVLLHRSQRHSRISSRCHCRPAPTVIDARKEGRVFAEEDRGGNEEGES